MSEMKMRNNREGSHGGPAPRKQSPVADTHRIRGAEHGSLGGDRNKRN